MQYDKWQVARESRDGLVERNVDLRKRRAWSIRLLLCRHTIGGCVEAKPFWQTLEKLRGRFQEFTKRARPDPPVFVWNPWHLPLLHGPSFD
jgi:hypothetical protein